MGLDTSHGAWHGAYSAFMRWREKIAELAGIPLPFMAGFFDPDPKSMSGIMLQLRCMEHRGDREEIQRVRDHLTACFPLSWDVLRPDPLHALLNHSDCEGEIAMVNLPGIADRLAELLPLLPDEDAGGHIGNWRVKTQTFIDGCRAAAEAREPLVFH